MVLTHWPKTNVLVHYPMGRDEIQNSLEFSHPCRNISPPKFESSLLFTQFKAVSVSPQYTPLPFLYDTAGVVYLAGAAEAGVCSCSEPLTKT